MLLGSSWMALGCFCLVLVGCTRLLGALGPHLIDFGCPAVAVHLNPPLPPLPPPVPSPRGGTPSIVFPGFGSLWGREREGENRDCSNTPRDPEGVGGF